MNDGGDWRAPEWMVREFARAEARLEQMPPGYRPVICPPIMCRRAEKKREAGQ